MSITKQEQGAMLAAAYEQMLANDPTMYAALLAATGNQPTGVPLFVAALLARGAMPSTSEWIKEAIVVAHKTDRSYTEIAKAFDVSASYVGQTVRTWYTDRGLEPPNRRSKPTDDEQPTSTEPVLSEQPMPDPEPAGIAQPVAQPVAQPAPVDAPQVTNYIPEPAPQPEPQPAVQMELLPPEPQPEPQPAVQMELLPPEPQPVATPNMPPQPVIEQVSVEQFAQSIQPQPMPQFAQPAGEDPIVPATPSIGQPASDDGVYHQPGAPAPMPQEAGTHFTPGQDNLTLADITKRLQAMGHNPNG